MQSMPLYTAQSSRQCDAEIIASGIPAFELMQRASAAVFHQVEQAQEAFRQPIIVLAGRGNNGADGMLVACLAKKAGYEVSIITVNAGAMTSAEGEKAKQMALQSNITIDCYSDEICFEKVLIIDAIYGTGLNRDLSLADQSLILAVNKSENAVIAVDVPSGLCADTGRVLGCAIKATKTVSFITRKRGLYTAKGPAYSGERIFNDLMSAFGNRESNKLLLEKIVKNLPLPVETLDIDALKDNIRLRDNDSHKGDYGHCVLIGGNDTMAGAIIMAAESCLRVGVGLVTVVTKPQHVAILNTRLPEVMTAVTDKQINDLLGKATAIAIGPGLGTDDWAELLWKKAWSSSLPLIVDASALFFLSKQKDLYRSVDWVMTPHPGEAAQLLETNTQLIQRDRFQAVQNLISRYQSIVVLKGAGSIVACHDSFFLSISGNPGMATAGTGDILTGIVGSLLSQGYEAFFASKLAVELHALAGDQCEQEHGNVGMIATDLVPYIRKILNS